MNTIKKISSLLLLTSVILMMSSCKKSKMLSSIEGNYIGSGTAASTSAPFVNQIIKVTKVNNKRVKVEPVSHTYITAFEVDIIRVGTKITSKDGDGFSVETSGSPYVIAFSNDPNETFGGTKQ